MKKLSNGAIWLRLALGGLLALAVVVGGISFVEHKYVRLKVPAVDDPSLWLNRNVEEALTELRAMGYSNSGAQSAWVAESYLRTQKEVTFVTERRSDLGLYVASKLTSPDWWPLYYYHSTVQLYVDEEDSIVGFKSSYSMLSK